MNRTVRIISRSTWGTTAPYPLIVTVTIPWRCPKCGAARGEPFPFNFYENGDSHSVHKWDNPCGHIDKYEDVLAEAKL